jgi:hypothetical protein
VLDNRSVAAEAATARKLLESLVGQTIETATGRPNTVVVNGSVAFAPV